MATTTQWYCQECNDPLAGPDATCARCCAGAYGIERSAEAEPTTTETRVMRTLRDLDQSDVAKVAQAALDADAAEQAWMAVVNATASRTCTPAERDALLNEAERARDEYDRAARHCTWVALLTLTTEPRP